MDEREWMACEDPRPMLAFVRGKLTDRKQRLFACACCRGVWGLIVDPACRAAVELAEGVADGQVKRKGQRRAFQAANKEAQTRHRLDQSGYRDADPRGSSLAALAATAAIATRLRVAYDDLEDKRRTVPSWEWAGWASAADDTSDSWEATVVAVLRVQCRLLRDISGNPFCPVPVNPAWRTPAGLALAQAAYENRELPAGTLDPHRLAVLADALEESGCDNAELLGHLRCPSVHVRGCWVVDLILSKDR